mgnify:CR=1 FL=1
MRSRVAALHVACGKREGRCKAVSCEVGNVVCELEHVVGSEGRGVAAWKLQRRHLDVGRLECRRRGSDAKKCMFVSTRMIREGARLVMTATAAVCVAGATNQSLSQCHRLGRAALTVGQWGIAARCSVYMMARLTSHSNELGDGDRYPHAPSTRVRHRLHPVLDDPGHGFPQG